MFTINMVPDCTTENFTFLDIDSAGQWMIVLLLAPSGSPGEGTSSSQQQLAKPVPMRRPEKSVSQARVAMTNSYEASLYEHSAAIYGHGRYIIGTHWVSGEVGHFAMHESKSHPKK